MGTGQCCPICSVVVGPHARYPRYVCGACAADARSRDGRPLVFFNADVSGGYRAEYADTREPYGSHECYVRGVRCWADEARFGGIVIQASEAPLEPRGEASAPHPGPSLARD